MDTTRNIRLALDDLDRVFHNEKDFQIEFITQLSDRLDGIVRPEFVFEDPSSAVRDRKHVDVFCSNGDQTTAIELKYPTAPLSAESSSQQFHDITESFDLSGTGAYDMAMYPFWSDVSAVERLVRADGVDNGHVVQLTNYSGCWTKQDQTLNGADFLMYDGREVSGRLSWSEGTSNRTKQDYPALELDGVYTLDWSSYSYSHPEDAEGETEFQYLLLQT